MHHWWSVVIVWSMAEPFPIPRKTLHKPSGLARVRLNGHDVYLGRYGSGDDDREYDRVIAEWLANGRKWQPASAVMTVEQIVKAFMAWALTYYKPTNCRSTEVTNFTYSLALLLRLYGSMPGGAFGPLQLKAIREVMVRAELKRTTINGRIRRIRQVFRWAASESMISGAVVHSLSTLMPLKRGRSDAVEPTPVQPVALAAVQAIRDHCRPPVIWSMVLVQLLTGMRPGELCRMRTRDLDTTGATWLYVPDGHKTAHFGHQRVIPIVADVQEILQPLLRHDLDSPIFITTRRKGKAYKPGCYRQQVERACDRAGIPRWSVNRLRHTAGTVTRRAGGLSMAQPLLGHKTVASTQHYAEVELAKAVEAAGLLARELRRELRFG